MARERKRYYIAKRNGYGQRWDILRLKFAPAAEVFSYSHSRIIGPFRTSTAAMLAADYRGGVSVAQAEKMVTAARPIAA